MAASRKHKLKASFCWVQLEWLREWDAGSSSVKRILHRLALLGSSSPWIRKQRLSLGDCFGRDVSALSLSQEEALAKNTQVVVGKAVGKKTPLFSLQQSILRFYLYKSCPTYVAQCAGKHYNQTLFKNRNKKCAVRNSSAALSRPKVTMITLYTSSVKKQ
jgi:hypothetical protein